jgi:hypothetical protein
MYASRKNAPIATVAAMIPRKLAHSGSFMLFSTEEASYAAGCNRINVSRAGLAGQVNYIELHEK